MWSFPGSYANRGSRTEQASSDMAKDCYFNKIRAILKFRNAYLQTISQKPSL